MASYTGPSAKLIKGILWVESGAASAQWKTKPMQIGVTGDPGLAAFLGGKEGGEIIMPAATKKILTASTVRSDPKHNLRAGVGYLIMRSANFSHKSVINAGAALEHETVKAGDSFSKIATRVGSTTDIISSLNPGKKMLKPGEKIAYKKGSVQKYVTSWRAFDAALVATRYNGGGDPNYEKKLNFVLSLL